MTIIATDKNQTTQSFNDIVALIESLSSEEGGNLISLDLADENIGDEGAIALAEALKGNTSITSLDLDSNNIGDEGAKALANALETNSTLTFLNLDNNNIGSEGAKALANVLETNSTLTSLRLSSNNIGAEGAEFIAKMLETNTKLNKLNLQNNQVGDEGAQFIAEALKINKILTILNLDANQIGDEGAKAFAKALEKNTSITTLHLFFNSIRYEEKLPIYHALKLNKEKILDKFNWRSLPEEMQTYALKDILFKNVAECRKYADQYATNGKDTEFLQEIYYIFTSREFKNAEQRASAIEDHYHVPASASEDLDWNCPRGAGAPEYEVFVPASESKEGRPELKCAGDVQAQPFTD